MRKQGGGFGFFVLLIVLVVALLLATRAWKAVMPVAAQALKPGSSASVPDHGQKEAGQAIRSGNLPDLKKMGQNTDDHIKQVKDAANGQD